MDSADEAKRQYIRAAPDPNEYVQIDKSIEDSFEFRYAGLVVEESPFGGCSIVCLKTVGLEVGDLCRVKVGNLSPLKSEIIWKKNLDNLVVRLGIKFLE